MTVAQLSCFDEVIDVRSPSEFAEDHVPGARNMPVLDDAERAKVGTIYKQVSAFEARKLGAVLTTRNIAHHIEDSLLDRPKDWRPLVYCWRGGKRSASMAAVLGEIGWHAATLAGGYRAYRRAVIEALVALPEKFRWCVICGRTGSGKSRLLEALDAAGAQVLDLEQLARHRGSVLGNVPQAPQPRQKWFESQVWAQLVRFDPARAVFVEAESRRIGLITVPDALINAIRAAECIRLDAELPLRVALLKDEYAHFADDIEDLCAKLTLLVPLHGRERISGWQQLAREGRTDELVAALLELHYDPAYGRSTRTHFAGYRTATVISLRGMGEADFAALAGELAGGR